jgi:hypothetical protein
MLEQLVGFCNFLDKTCGNEHGFAVKLLGISGQIGYQGFHIWYPKFKTGIIRILGYCKSAVEPWMFCSLLGTRGYY